MNWNNWNCEMCRWNVNGYGEKLADKWRIHSYCFLNGCQYEPKNKKVNGDKK